MTTPETNFATEPAHPTHDSWLVELRMDNGNWTVAFPTNDRDIAVERLRLKRQHSPERQWRLVRLSETYTVEEAP